MSFYWLRCCSHHRTATVFVLGVGTVLVCRDCDERVPDPASPTVRKRAELAARDVDPGGP